MLVCSVATVTKQRIASHFDLELRAAGMVRCVYREEACCLRQ